MFSLLLVRGETPIVEVKQEAEKTDQSEWIDELD